MKPKPRYWMCIIGPVDGNKLPKSADNPPRLAAIKAIEKLTSKKRYTDFECWSGWGVTPEEKEAILRVNIPEDK